MFLLKTGSVKDSFILKLMEKKEEVVPIQMRVDEISFKRFILEVYVQDDPKFLKDCSVQDIIDLQEYN
jgi:hypothetical protein